MSGAGEGSRELLIATDRAESGDTLVSVSDTCPGLAPAAQENLFKAFYTTKPNGFGLGLSICRSIIETHGGRLWASANAPRGAVFQFRSASLPAARRSRQALSAQRPRTFFNLCAPVRPSYSRDRTRSSPSFPPITLGGSGPRRQVCDPSATFKSP